MSTQVATQEDRMTAIEGRIDKNVSAAITVGTGGITFQNAGEVMEYAKMMAVSGSAVPKHLRGQPGACLGIIDDAIRFRTSPYALARKSFFVNDNLAYEAQVIAGIINRFAPLKERPNVTYEGDGADRKCFVTFTFKDGAVRVYESPKFKDIKPKNSPLWQNDPDQQHAYYSLRAGARRYCPEIILGMFDIDEMRVAQMRDVTPQRPSVMQKLQSASRQSNDEGFNVKTVEEQTGALIDADTGEVIDDREIVRETGEQTDSIMDSEPGLSSEGSDTAEKQSPDASAKPSAGDPPSDPKPADGDQSEDPTGSAYRAGRDAKIKGLAKKAMPAEYRADPDLLESYLEGYDETEIDD